MTQQLLNDENETAENKERSKSVLNKEDDSIFSEF